jgi:hypothetical protein
MQAVGAGAPCAPLAASLITVARFRILLASRQVRGKGNTSVCRCCDEKTTGLALQSAWKL